MNSIFPAGHVFPPTHWTLIAAAEGPHRDAALSQLYRIYWRPLCAQARRMGLDEDEVEDAVQEFLVQIFRDDSLQRADPSAGRFRSYLIGALRHAVWRRRTREQAQKRGGGAAVVPLAEAEAVGAEEDARAFDAEWAQALLDHAVERFEAEVRGHPESVLLAPWVFEHDLLSQGLSHVETAARLRITVAAVKSRIFRLRERFRQIVREEVRRTVASDAECESELRYLCSVLDQTEARSAIATPAAA